MTEAERSRHTADLAKGVPIKPWPFGMPCSAAPEVVVIGVSPGNSPTERDADFETAGKPGAKPTFGDVKAQKQAGGGFFYPDKRRYWDKVRSLCCHFIRRVDPSLPEEECVALASHLNLGTGQAGEATVSSTDSGMTRWVAKLLNEAFQPSVVVLFGLKKIIKARSFDWNDANGLQVDWKKPTAEQQFGKYRFQLWEARSSLGKRIAVLAWPNHPSRHPFAGAASGVEWQDSLMEASSFLKIQGF